MCEMYHARLWSKNRTSYTLYQYAVTRTELEAATQGAVNLRALVEQRVEAILRGLEGVAPDAEVESLGWRPLPSVPKETTP